LLVEVVVEGDAAGVLALAVDAAGVEEAASVPVLFSVFDVPSVEAAGLSTFASRSAFPPSDFGAVPLSPLG
jgi:hypothetical protein